MLHPLVLRRLILPMSVAGWMLICGGIKAEAQQRSSQTFRVIVPSRIAVSAPSFAEIRPDQADTPQDFPVQTWLASGNASTGTVVEFSLDEVFTHHVNPQQHVDAEMRLYLGNSDGSAGWTLTRPVDRTSIADDDPQASVQVTSSGSGSAAIGLRVRFLAQPDLKPGEYSACISCTVTTP